MAYITIFIKVYLLTKIKIKRFLNFELDSQITNDYPYFVETHVPQMQFNLGEAYRLSTTLLIRSN